MWDLNDSPDQREYESDGGCSMDGDDEKGKRVGSGSVSVSVSNSSSSAVVIEDGSDEEDGGGGGGGERGLKKRNSSSKIFGVALGEEESDPPVTRQFFPVDQDQEMGTTTSAGLGFPRAQWVGVKFCQTEPLGKSVDIATASAAAASPPIKKSRRGPRSRSSQYRGVTFYRRTGRWESHIWSV